VNGVTWSARNVAAPGYFTDNAEDISDLHQVGP
jgi:hypothetical protein